MFLTAVMIPVQTSIATEAPDVEIQAVTDGIAAEFIAGGTREVLSLNVRLVGPDRFVFEHKVEDSVLQWIPPGDLADGYYHWEAWVVSTNAGASKDTAAQSRSRRGVRANSPGHRQLRRRKRAARRVPASRYKTGRGPPPSLHASPAPSWTSWSRRRMRPKKVPATISSARMQAPITRGLPIPSSAARLEGENTSGSSNSFFGFRAGFSNTEGSMNAFLGRGAGQSNTAGSFQLLFRGTLPVHPTRRAVATPFSAPRPAKPTPRAIAIPFLVSSPAFPTPRAPKTPFSAAAPARPQHHRL